MFKLVKVEVSEMNKIRYKVLYYCWVKERALRMCEIVR